MNIVKSLNYLKNKIDNYEYEKDAKGNPITGKKALCSYLKDNCTSNSVITEDYIRKEVRKLYTKLEQNEAGKILNSDHFSFMKDDDILYHILKALHISFEDLMEGGNESYRPKTEIDGLHEDHEEFRNTIQQLTEIIQLSLGKTERTDLQDKIVEYNNFFGNCLNFSKYNSQLRNATGPEAEKLAQNFRFNMLMAINNVTGQIFDFSSIYNLVTQNIPIEYLQLQYYRAVKYSKLSDLSRAILNLEDGGKKNYYDNLSDKLGNEIFSTLEEDVDLSECLKQENYLRYSCIVCQFDFINRTTIDLLNSIFNNFRYRTAETFSKNEKMIKNIASTPFYLATPKNWGEYILAVFDYNNTKFQYNFSKVHAEKFREFLKKTGSMLRQLSVYLANIKLRNYTEQVVEKITKLFNEYLLIVENVVYRNNWIIKPNEDAMIDDFIDQFDHHTKIISKDMAGIIDENN